MSRLAFLAGLVLGAVGATVAARLLVTDEREQCMECGNTVVHSALRVPG